MTSDADGEVPNEATEVPMAVRVAEAVLRQPEVDRLSGGPFGTITTHLPGKRIVGVRIPEDGPVEIAVVVRLDRPLRDSADAVRARARSVLGDVPVDVTISDVVGWPADTGPPSPDS